MVAMPERPTTTRERPAQLRLDPNTTSSAIEGLSRRVLIEHPQVEGSCWPKSKKSQRRLREQL